MIVLIDPSNTNLAHFVYYKWHGGGSAFISSMILECNTKLLLPGKLPNNVKLYLGYNV